MQIVLLTARFLFNNLYAQIGYPCDISIGEGIELSNGMLTGITDCNLLCIGLDLLILVECVLAETYGL